VVEFAQRLLGAGDGALMAGDGYVLTAPPGKSQGRPPRKLGLKSPSSTNGLPNLRLQ
jgi:hypothetical protein